MMFSETVAQQREKQTKALQQIVMASLAGSAVLHSGGLLLKVGHLWQPSEPEEAITIVVTEPEESLEPAIAPEEPVTKSSTPSSVSAPTAAVEPFIEPSAIDSPNSSTAITPVEPTVEAPITEEPTEPLVAENEPEPAPTPAVAEDVVPDETLSDEPTEPEPGNEIPSSESSEAIAASAPDTRSLNDLLSDLRRVRQQNSQTARSIIPSNRDTLDETPGRSTPSGRGNSNGTPRSSAPSGGTGNDTIAAAPTRPSEPVAPESRSTPTRQGSQSREITCRGCNFDYPDSAAGAEGTAQVIVETDAQGRVVSVLLSRSSGNAALDQAALEQARRRVRLNNARAGESYPIDIDFVQPNSEAAERVRERGDRRSITVSDPEPTTVASPESPSPETAIQQSPVPAETRTPSVAPDSTESMEPSASPAASPVPDSTETTEPSADPVPSSSPSPNSPSRTATPSSAPSPSPAPAPSPSPAPAPSPSPAPVERSEPAEAPAPRPVQPPRPAPSSPPPPAPSPEESNTEQEN